MYDVPEGGAYAVLYTVLGVFFTLAIISAGYGSSILPKMVQDVLVAKSNPSAATDGVTKEQSVTVKSGSGLLSTDFFL